MFNLVADRFYLGKVSNLSVVFLKQLKEEISDGQ
jgi:hypothetical protein